MKIVLLSGGSGKRLWPLSNESRSKQFLRLLQKEDGTYESMLQRVYRQIQEVLPDVEILISTGSSQKDVILSQIGNNVTIIEEPERRNTYPAMMLTTSYLVFEKNISLDEVIVFMPVDPYVTNEYFETIKKMSLVVKYEKYPLVLMGILPTYPSEKYGYIIPKQISNKNSCIQVKSFKEKPDLKTANQLINEGAVWNGGVFACKLTYLFDKLKNDIKANTFNSVYNQYYKLSCTSFDYAVVEKEKQIGMVLYSGEWKDLGTWNTLTEQIKQPIFGEATIGEEAKDTYIINELSIPIVALGTKSIIIAASPDGILVSDLHKSSYMKPYVENIGECPMYEEYNWGKYSVLDLVKYEDNINCLTKNITIYKGYSLIYKSNKYESKSLTILNGILEVTINKIVHKFSAGDIISLDSKQKYILKAISSVNIIEVQRSKEIFKEEINVLYD